MMGCAHIWGAKEAEKEQTLRLQVHRVSSDLEELCPNPKGT